MKLIIDGNSFLNAALLRGVDHDGGRVITDEGGKQVQVNSALYGVEGFWDKLTADIEHFEVAPRQCVLVWDGENAKLKRRSFLPTYKAGRDKAPEVSEQLNLARAQVTKMALALGMHIVKQKYYEADDVIGYLAKHLRLEPNVILTSDGDLSVLVDENTGVWRLGELNKNPCGPFPHKYIRLYKSLVGDTSDKLPGAKGFGDSAWLDLVRVFGLGALDAMIELIENGQIDFLKEDVDDFKPLQKIIDSKDMVTTSWKCAGLLVDEVNTMRKPWDLQAGMVAQWADLDDSLRVPELRRFYGSKTLVTASNYDTIYKKFRDAVRESPFVALDIETSSSEESDEWMERLKALTESDRDRLDVLGHELTGMSLTFGANTQHTIYMSVDHRDTVNITADQCREICQLIPQSLQIVIQNRQFEFSVLYRTWGDKWRDNGWHGFVPNAVDTKVGASYTNENLKKGLKQRSLHHLGYVQTSYEETTTFSGPVGDNEEPDRLLSAPVLPSGGVQSKCWQKVIKEAEYSEKEVHIVDQDTGEITGTEWVRDQMLVPEVKEWWETRQYKMRELTALQVVDYGCDDTICTAALHTHYKLVMEVEGTWQTYMEVEQLPEYLTSLAYVQGIPVSQEKLRVMESKDDVAYAKAWEILRAYLLKSGWEGSVCPVFDKIDASSIKAAVAIVADNEEPFETNKRKLESVVHDVSVYLGPGDDVELFLDILRGGKVEYLNEFVRDCFTGEPTINLASPKQIQTLFYRVIGIKPRIFNKLTAKQREEESFRLAFKKMRQEKDGKAVVYEPAEWTALITKASTDDTAVDWALAKDPITDEQRAVLLAYRTIKTVMTRRNLFYKTYKAIPHWRDGRIHPSLNQSEAVTRRYSSSGPNVQQLPKRGEGVEFRQIILPHCKGAVVCSLDFSGQELRSMAEQSGDENLTACYVGENLKDPHSLTAVAAAISLWGEEVAYDDFITMLHSEDKVQSKKAKALRADGKTVNFASQYDAMAPKIAETLLTDEETAQSFLDAKDRAFPKINLWKEEVRAGLEKDGFASTMMGARRHLSESLMSDDKWEAAKAGRQGPNFKIQGSGAEQSKLAMASMWQRGLFSGKYDAVFYAPIHDEVVFSVHCRDALAVIRAAHECMVQPYGGMTIPIVSSISLGLNFGEQIEAGDFVDDARINAALDKLFGGTPQ